MIALLLTYMFYATMFLALIVTVFFLGEMLKEGM